jgi:enoyl-CoA hydratase/carnithine racemase
MKVADAKRMLEAGEVIDAATAVAIGLAKEVCPPDELLSRAQAHAEAAIGQVRLLHAEKGLLAQLRVANAEESALLGVAILQPPFLGANERIFAKQGKTGLAWTFWLLRMTAPILSHL